MHITVNFEVQRVLERSFEFQRVLERSKAKNIRV
jgi:hypothetical protein